MEGQDELIIRRSESEKVGLEDDKQALLDDAGYNADLYRTSPNISIVK